MQNELLMLQKLQNLQRVKSLVIAAIIAIPIIALAGSPIIAWLISGYALLPSWFTLGVSAELLILGVLLMFTQSGRISLLCYFLGITLVPIWLHFASVLNILTVRSYTSEAVAVALMCLPVLTGIVEYLRMKKIQNLHDDFLDMHRITDPVGPYCVWIPQKGRK